MSEILRGTTAREPDRTATGTGAACCSDGLLATRRPRGGIGPWTTGRVSLDRRRGLAAGAVRLMVEHAV
ncbi:hypothetical protein ABZV34_39980, partial [Streptomyces sp. NPDC005195]|uniref:hypothetical protein n=1 Tax=Streptomyces sp. NPDC005195 TaxID=3154561 RepID=UPI0033A1F713